MASEPDEHGSLVVLKCIEPHYTEPDSNCEEILISTAQANTWDFSSILSHHVVKIVTDRSRLIEHSSYFDGLLSGNFRESHLECISIEWNIETFLSILKFLFGCVVDVTADNFLPLFESTTFFGVDMVLSKCKIWLTESALFFGVDMVLSKCKIWLTEVNSDSGLWPLPLEELVHIWKFGLDHATDVIPELCVRCLAKNFMSAMSINSFVNIPYDLLLSCLKHPCLTVDSEKDLCGGLLAWLAVNTEQSAEEDYSEILKEVRLNLLPLWFLPGERNSQHFSKFADENINALLTRSQHPSTSSINELGDGDLSHLRIRLTEYSKKLDLSGCPNVKLAVLLLSALPSSYCTDPSLRKSVKQSAYNHERFDEDKFQISLGLWPITSFKAVQEVDVSNCPMLHIDAAIECFSKSFPSLRTLKAANFLNFSTTKLRNLVQKCPLLSDIDLTVDSSPLIPTRVSVLSSGESRTPISSLPFHIYNIPFASTLLCSPRLLQSNITRLVLAGRTDISDSDVRNISGLCISLTDLNLKACTSLTDAGIAALILKCVKLSSLVVCDTSFGRGSVQALCSNIPSYDATPEIEKLSESFAYKLQTLHMGGCKAVDATSLSELLSRAPKLKSLCLKETELVNDGLYSFSGSFLEMIDVSYTKVTAAALSHIVSRNPCLKQLNVRDCKNMVQQESNTTSEDFLSLAYPDKNLYFELGRSCKLEKIVVGWGFSFFSLEALKPAITMLREIHVGIGATIGEDGLKLLPAICPLLESVDLLFQVISDSVIINLALSLKHLKELSLSYCLGVTSALSFQLSMPNLIKLKLERVTPWMTNEDLVLLTHNCPNITHLSLLGCTLLNPESQDIISKNWPGLISMHLEECGEVTVNGITSLSHCKALEDLALRHNGCGIQRNFIRDIALKMPMLRKLSLDLCDAIDDDFEVPDIGERYFLSSVKIARCKENRSSIKLETGRKLKVHKETFVMVWNSKALTRTVVKERL